ncbi:SMI1/KNR4 family protein [Hahella sp. KA22]|uniref:SMI1/KNR4 family protein n=1 Tax=Hahella sp. KA22 TaxID=1628392 RepID=UPI000FDF14E8|nr:SMI1/KNR4 family protein [Hahella sp. KA22]AZZ92165.1 SMI1/KNR4 family protein [Hahella sp. KA22]QAY55536.1 SMI1/KNR4 family protein [Hahella sp. KA22]
MSWAHEIKEKYRCIDENLDNSVLGASDKEINELQDTVGKKLPEDYVSFLEVFGINDGGLLSSIPAFTDVKNLILTYEEIDEFPEDFPEGDWMIVGAGHAGIDLAMNVSNGLVHYSSCGDIGQFYADSFKKLVCQKAYVKYEILSCAESVHISSSVKSVEECLKCYNKNETYKEISRMLREFGPPIDELCDQIRIVGEGENIKYFAEITEQGGLMLYFGGYGADKAGQRYAKIIGANIN